MTTHAHATAHDHAHGHHHHDGEECCPFHEPITEKQVKNRLLVGLYGGVVLVAGWILKGLGLDFSGSALAWVACFLLAGPILGDAISGLKRGHIGFPSLVALAFLACLSQGETITAGLVAFFMILADQLENRSAIGARLAIESLVKSTPDVVHLMKDGQVQDIPLEQLQQHQVIQVRPGELIPIDGKISKGETSLDESSMTGESLPVDKSLNSEVYAGTTNLTGVIEVEALKIGEDTTLGKVKQLILSAASSKTPFTSTVENNAGWYTQAIIMFAALTWIFQSHSDEGLTRAITILIMACPCSLVLATPSVMIASITAAARAGILIRQVVELEHFHKIKHIFFDKTGTLTTGQMELIKLEPFGEHQSIEILQLAGGLASQSNHPHSKGVTRSLDKARLEAKKIEQVQEVHGKGLTGELEGDRVYLGRPDWISAELNLQIHEEHHSEGRLLLASQQKGEIAVLHLEDTIREDAQQSLKALKELGIKKQILVTGDAKGPAEKVAKQLNLDEVHARMMPADKLAQLEKSRKEGYTTAVVGDGINDAPVLAAGDVGIAMGALGSQVAIESASIALMGSNLDRLPFLHHLSKRTTQTVRINILVGVGILLIGLFLSAMGIVSPVIAAILHNVSAIFILFHSAQLVKLKPEALDHV